MTTKAGLMTAASHALQNGPQLFARVEDGGVVIGGRGGEVVPDSTGLYAVVAEDPDAVRAQLRLDTSVSRSDVLYIGKAEDSLRFFNDEERQDMMDTCGQEVVCHWCGEKYHITPAEIAALEAPPERARA